MEDINKLKSENQSLRDRNKNLEFKLNIAKLWMIREIKESVKKISKNKISKMTASIKDDFAFDNLEEIVTEKIREYFGDYILMNIGSNITESIISAELAYYNLKQNPNYDGFGVVSSYHKGLDSIIEQFIVKGYRKFAKKSEQIHLRKNDPLEKALHSVVNKGYILSVGRLYHLLTSIKKDKKLYDYGSNFKLYLDKYIYLKDVLLSDDFINLYLKLIDTEILGKKRHSGQINFVETRDARKLLIGGLKDKNSLIYLLLSTQDMDY